MPPPGNTPYAGAPVMGPGQGILPLGSHPSFNPFGTGQRGRGPDPPPGVGPFEQTGTDIRNLFDYGTTMPKMGNAQIAKMYNMPLGSAYFNKPQAHMAAGMAEIDRIFRNVGSGIDYYAGQLMPFSMLPGAGGPQFSVPPGGGAPAFPGPDPGPGPGGYVPGPGHPGYGGPVTPPAGITPGAQSQFDQGNPFDALDELPEPFDPNAAPVNQQRWGGAPVNPFKRRVLNWFRGRPNPPPPPKVKPLASDLF